MAKTSTSLNIENFKVKVQTYDKGDPGTGFAMLGVDASGVYRVDEDEVLHYIEGAGGGGGAEALGDLSDVSDATATNRNVLIADGTDWVSRAVVEADLPQLNPTKFNFNGVKATASGIEIENAMTDYDVDTLVEEFDTNDFFGVDSETFSIPNDFGGYYQVIIDLNPTIDSLSTPLLFHVDMYLDAVSYDRWTVDCSDLFPTRMTWTFIALFDQTDAITFKVSKEGGTDGSFDEVNVHVTLKFIGKAP